MTGHPWRVNAKDDEIIQRRGWGALGLVSVDVLFLFSFFALIEGGRACWVVLSCVFK